MSKNFKHKIKRVSFDSGKCYFFVIFVSTFFCILESLIWTMEFLSYTLGYEFKDFELPKQRGDQNFECPFTLFGEKSNTLQLIDRWSNRAQNFLVGKV